MFACIISNPVPFDLFNCKDLKTGKLAFKSTLSQIFMLPISKEAIMGLELPDSGLSNFKIRQAKQINRQKIISKAHKRGWGSGIE